MGFIRIGDILEGEETGGRRFLEAAENLCSSILFKNVSDDNSFYVHRPPLVSLQMDGFDLSELQLGEYESHLLSKLMNPDEDSVICIEGDIGSGKTTTINYLLNLLRKRVCETCALKKSMKCNKLVAHIDFRISKPQLSGELDRNTDPSTRDLLKIICAELRSRISSIVTRDYEYNDFWTYLFESYDESIDGYINEVVRFLLAESPYELRDTNVNIEKRGKIFDDLSRQNINWHFRYLILLWRFIQERQFRGHRGCVLIIFDNVDTLSSNLQRKLIDIVLRSASKNGPTIVILLRPETRRRQGLADLVVEIVYHKGPSPFDVIRSRMQQYFDNPDFYLMKDTGLDYKQTQIIKSFFSQVQNQFNNENDNPLEKFICEASGNSIRIGLVLAQGIFKVRVSDMQGNFSVHHLVRACITNGHQQFRERLNYPIQNIFRITPYEEAGNYLLKPRLIKYILDRNKSFGLSILRNVFVEFGYEDEKIKSALNQLMRSECQILSSDGFDYLRSDWGDEQETLYLTAIGEGYGKGLFYTTDFLQEIMLDAFVDSNTWPKLYNYDTLTQKLHLLYLFLRELNIYDSREVKSYIHRHSTRKYVSHFGKNMLTVDLLQSIYPSIGRLLQSVAFKYPQSRLACRNNLQDMTSLLRWAEEANKDLLGLYVSPVEEIII